MVYSRETTCSIADLVAGFFPLDDISEEVTMIRIGYGIGRRSEWVASLLR